MPSKNLTEYTLPKLKEREAKLLKKLQTTRRKEKIKLVRAEIAKREEPDKKVTVPKKAVAKKAAPKKAIKRAPAKRKTAKKAKVSKK